jgi:hypothetical protein
MKKLKALVILVYFSIFIGCEKDDKMTHEKSKPYYFMSAFIDNVNWSTSGDFNAHFYTTNFMGKYSMSVIGDNINIDPKPLDNGKRIIFSFGFMPKPGKYNFKNEGSLQLDSGIIAIYTYWNQNHFDTKWSNDGYIEIKSISRDSISGTFSLTVKGDPTNNEITKISDGEYNAKYDNGYGFWPGSE